MADGQTQASETTQATTITAIPQGGTTTVATVKPQGEPEPQVDWKAEARKWEARAKENKAKADAYDEAQEAAKSDLQKAQDKIARLEKERDERKKADQHAALVKKVAEANKVDASYLPLLTGETEAELTEQAKLIGRRFAEPVASEGGKPADVSDKDADMRAFAKSFFGSRK